jgi:hypothetical protein
MMTTTMPTARLEPLRRAPPPGSGILLDQAALLASAGSDRSDHLDDLLDVAD